MKQFANYFVGFLIGIAVVCGFWFFMYKAVIEPVDVNAFQPSFSPYWIAGWILYIAFFGALYVKVRMSDK